MVSGIEKFIAGLNQYFNNKTIRWGINRRQKISTEYFIEGCHYIRNGEIECTEGLHIGIADIKDVFNLRVYPKLGLNNLEAWLSFMKNKPIINELGIRLHLEQMIVVIKYQPSNIMNLFDCEVYNGIWYRRLYDWQLG